ncbi:MAG: hypothetical protein J1F32_01230 [Erysipelotrichales bacterium]|nr:hypothetical protein [Erysipelotrichales bacterium]
MKKSTTIIENEGKIYLCSILNNTNLIDTSHIKSGEKYPLWDGDIILYNNMNFKNSNLVGRIPIQLKSMYSNLTNKISVDVISLKRYFDELGILYFVYKSNGTHKKLYYANLQRFTLNQYIVKAGSSKTISINLTEFPLEASEIIQLLNSIINDRNLQRDIEKDILCFEDAAKKYSIDKMPLLINLPITDLFDLVNGLSTQKPYLYLKKENQKLIAIDKLDTNVNFFTTSKYMNSIYTGDKKYFDSFEIKHIRNNCTLVIDDFLSITLQANAKCKIKYKLNGAIEKRIIDLEFLINFLKNKEIHFENGKPLISFKDYSNEININKLTLLLDLMNKLFKIKTFLNINKDFDFSLLNQSNYTLIERFYNTLFKDGYIVINNLDRNIFLFDFFNWRICVYAIKNDNNKNEYKLYDLFQNKELLFTYKTPESNRVILNIIYIVIHDYPLKNPLLQIDNVDYDYFTSVVLRDCQDKSKLDPCNQIGLQLIDCFDKTGDNLFLSIAKKIFTNLHANNEENDTIFLNMAQIQYRLKELDNESKKSIIILKNKTDDIAIKFACSILLDYAEEADYYYSCLDDKLKNSIELYPIFTCYKIQKMLK